MPLSEDNKKQGEELLELLETRKKRSNIMTLIATVMMTATLILYGFLINTKRTVEQKNAEIEAKKDSIESVVVELADAKAQYDSLSTVSNEHILNLQIKVDSLESILRGSGTDRFSTMKMQQVEEYYRTIKTPKEKQFSPLEQKTFEILNAVDHSKKLITLHSSGASKAQLTSIKKLLNENSFNIRSGHNYDVGNEPKWLSTSSAVLYYSEDSKKTALELADLMEKATRSGFEVKRGSGYGVIKGQEKNTFFIHFINRPKAN